jgi:hypothetical protein
MGAPALASPATPAAFAPAAKSAPPAGAFIPAPKSAPPSSPFAASGRAASQPAAAAPAQPEAAAVPSKNGGSARQALRVAVEVLSRGSGTFLVRILEEGDAAPARGHEALLVPLVPGVDLRDG